MAALRFLTGTVGTLVAGTILSSVHFHADTAGTTLAVRSDIGVGFIKRVPLLAVRFIGLVMGSVLKRVSVVVQHRSIAEIGKSIVGAVTVSVPYDHSVRSGSDECGHDKLVNKPMLPARMKGDVQVSTPIDARGSEFGGYGALHPFSPAVRQPYLALNRPDLPRRGNFVAPFISWCESPIFNNVHAIQLTGGAACLA